MPIAPIPVNAADAAVLFAKVCVWISMRVSMSIPLQMEDMNANQWLNRLINYSVISLSAFYTLRYFRNLLYVLQEKPLDRFGGVVFLLPLSSWWNNFELFPRWKLFFEFLVHLRGQLIIQIQTIMSSLENIQNVNKCIKAVYFAKV